MNFKKLLIVAAAVAVIIATYKFFTRIDRGDAVAVATAFTKAMKNKDTATAASYYLPDQAEAWQQKVDDKIGSMRGNTTEMTFEHIPAAPAFTPPVTVAGKTHVVSADKGYTLEMTQVDGKWYVSKMDF